MNTIWHFMINIILMKVIGLNNFDAFIIAFSSFIIDLDHFIRVFLIEKKKSWKDGMNWLKIEASLNRPHFFIFHNIEFILIFIIIGYYLNYYLLLIAIGFLIHYLEDCLTYIVKKKPFSWINYYVLTLYLLNRKNIPQ